MFSNVQIILSEYSLFKQGLIESSVNFIVFIIGQDFFLCSFFKVVSVKLILLRNCLYVLINSIISKFSKYGFMEYKVFKMKILNNYRCCIFSNRDGNEHVDIKIKGDMHYY